MEDSDFHIQCRIDLTLHMRKEKEEEINKKGMTNKRRK
jgi:hypothetical protein